MTSNLADWLQSAAGLHEQMGETGRFCAAIGRNRIRRPAFFGSVLRDDFSPESDVDVLVEFEPAARVGLITPAGMEIDLKPEVMRGVFKDAGFADDVVKTNTVQILRQADIDDIKSL